MKTSICAMVLGVLLSLVSPIRANDAAVIGGGSGNCGSGCAGSSCEVPCGVCPPGFVKAGPYVEAEATLFQYHRDDGIRIGTGTNESGIFEVQGAPRITVGYTRPDGVGLRFRWWEFDQRVRLEDAGEGDGLDVTTYTMDLEAYSIFPTDGLWTTEVSAGVRYNDFEETMSDVGASDFRRNHFDGWGILLGMRLSRDLCGFGQAFGQLRYSFLAGEKSVFNQDGGTGGDPNPAVSRDATQHVLEASLGYQYVQPLRCGADLVFSIAYEWQSWFDYTSAFAANNEGTFGNDDHAGFYGAVLRAGFIF